MKNEKFSIRRHLRGYRLFTAILLIFLFSFFIFLTACNQQPYTAEYYDVFDTYTVIVSYGKPVPPELHEELVRLHQLYDIYNNYEGVVNVKTINDAAGTDRWFSMEDGELSNLIRRYMYFHFVADDTVNVTLGSVLRLWHDYREEGTAVPSPEELQEAMSHCGYDKLDWDAVNRRYRLNDPLASLDVGALAKGYAADVVGRMASEMNFIGTISIGGSIWTSDRMPLGKKTWTIGIQNPDGGIARTIEVEPGLCLATSGDYERYYTVDGVRYHHIIDPATLYPAAKRGIRSITIVCGSAAFADYISTYEFIRNNEELITIYDADAYYIS